MAPLSWAGRQVRGWARNVYQLFTRLDPRQLLPAAWVSTLVFLRDSLPRALGFTRSNRSHITGVVVFSIFLVVASFTILTYVAVLFFLLAMPIALLRLWPAVNQRWPLSASSWPLWTVKGSV